MQRTLVGALTVTWLLACGGVGGPPVSDFATRTAGYLGEENEVDCPAYFRTETVPFGG